MKTCPIEQMNTFTNNNKGVGHLVFVCFANFFPLRNAVFRLGIFVTCLGAKKNYGLK